MWTVGSLLYKGKAKEVYAVKGAKNYVCLQFNDSLTAFNGRKRGTFSKKGQINRDISSYLFQKLEKEGVMTHWVSDHNSSSLIVKKLDMIFLEVIVRNFLAGSTAQKFKLKEGEKLSQPLLELYYKDDKLQDPFINDEQALWLKAVDSLKDIKQLKTLALDINQRLTKVFSKIGIDVIDFKLEFGKKDYKFILADELSPDNFRLWDQKTKKRLDKDRFRKDLGGVREAYDEVLVRIKKGE